MSAGSHLTRFFRHSSVYLIGNLLNRIGAFLLLPLYTHYLSVAEYGALELFYAVMAVIFGVLSVGLAHATLRFYFEYEQPADRRALVSTNLIAAFAISVAGVALVAPWSGQLSAWIFGSRDYTVGIYLILATIVLELSSQVSLAYLRAIERSGLFVVIALGKLLVQISINTYLVMVEQAGVQGVLLGNLLTVAAGWLVLTIFTVRHCGLVFHPDKAGPVLRYSYPFLLSTLVGLVSSNADRFIINGLLSLQVLGLYALALKFSKLLEELIGEPFNRAYGAFRFSIMHDPEASAIQARIVRYLLVVAAAAALGLAYFTQDLLRVISAPEFWQAANVLPFLLVASVLKVLAYPLQTGILYHKQPKQIFLINVVAAFVSVVANLLLIPVAGLFGACAALILTAAVEVYLTNRLSQRYFPVRYAYRRWLVLAAITLVFGVLGVVADQQSVWNAFSLKIGLYLLYLTAVLLSPALEHGELAALKTLRQRLASGRAGGSRS